ncbi:hypothetical protein [Edwardsiella tarda]|uniref:hypothetical protein n=1 Tax=Edwardsiella tarda TaxID=636 RepID=UPI003F6582B6
MSNGKKHYTPLPEPGDFVWCYFPQMLGQPGPKPRPALVVAVAEEDNAVKVVYGTSQKINKIYSTEFVLKKGESGFAISGLAYDTKFDMNTLVQLPYDSDWFDFAPVKNGQPTSSPVMGALHPTYIPAMLAAYKKVKKSNKAV